MKAAKLFIYLLLAGSIICKLSFAQFTQQGSKLVGTGAVGNTVYQGKSVAISSDGNTLVEGGYYDNSQLGAIWVFTRSGGVWSQQGPKLAGTGAPGNSWQGISVAISSDGNTVAVGGQADNNGLGAVWVFTRSSGVWSQQGPKLVGTGAIGSNVSQGCSVALSSDGNTLVEGGNNDNSYAGAIWVFTRTGGVWTQQGSKLVGTGATGSSIQGRSVALSSNGNTLIEGGSGDNNNLGAVWIFFRNAGVWVQQGPKLVGSGSVGSVVSQGTSVAISSDGNTAVEGGVGDNSFIGAAWVFVRTGNIWLPQGSKLVGTGGVGVTFQGFSVSISSDGNAIVSGGDGDNGDMGAFWAFTRNSGFVWTQLGAKYTGTGAAGNANQGGAVAISSEGTVVSGGTGDNNGAGAVWVFNDPTIGIRTISTETPSHFSLEQNYPNPFNPSTKIKYQIAKSSLVTLKVYDVLGREVAVLVNETQSPGTYEATFDAINLASDVYFYRLQTEAYYKVMKMILVK